MNRRDFLKTTAAASATPLLTHAEAPAAPAATRPNVLYVFSDQHRAVSLPGEPFNEAEAPTFDRFRRDNLSMNACISNYPLCAPHRAILVSGLYSPQNGVEHNEQTLQPTMAGLGNVFKNAGYNTGYVGKWHLYHGEGTFVPPGEYRFGFDDWHVWANTNKHYNGITFNQVTGEKEIVPGYQPTRMTDEAIDFLKGQRKAEKPWFLVLSWNPPHPPFNPPPEDQKPYDPATLKFRPNIRMPTPADALTMPYPQLENMQALRTAEQGYYGGITAVDKEFARLLQFLDDNHMADNTIVIYTSDHGECMGSHGRMAKQVPYEESCRVPFFMRHPQQKNVRRASEVLFSSVDIYPTVCGLAGVPIPQHCAGKDYSGMMLGKTAGFKEPEMVFLMNEKGPPDRQEVDCPTYRGVRTKTHTYAVQLDGRWCLFENTSDPYQLKNLVKDETNKALMARFDAAMIAWSKSVGDSFPYDKVLDKYSSYPT